MKADLSSSEKSKSSSATTTTTATSTMSVEESENRDSSCYFPGCRKDANCSCEICLASINATLDLMPMSIQKSSLTRLSYAPHRESAIETTPISFDPTVVTTPSSVSRPISKVSPPPKKMHTKKSGVIGDENPSRKTKNKGISGIGVVLKVVLVLGLAFCLEIGFCSVVNGVLKPKFTTEIVRNAGERSPAAGDLRTKLRFVEDELKGAVNDRKVSSCRDSDSKWEISQDGLMLNSKCILYKSAVEEVSIWGWPLQTAGLLRIGFSSSSITVLSGRATKWPDGKFGYSIREANASWVQTRWSTSVLQLDPNTWVLEYSRSSVLDSSSLLSLTTDLLKHVMFPAVRNINREFLWLFSASEGIISKSAPKGNAMTPT